MREFCVSVALAGVCHLPTRLVLRSTSCVSSLTSALLISGGRRENVLKELLFNVNTGRPNVHRYNHGRELGALNYIYSG